MGSQQVVTLWFITAADPRAVLAAEPAADRGYARKLLAQLNPAWPLTHIGDFDMNRSAPPGDGEFYIGGYRGLTVVQTVLPDVPHNWSLSGLPQLTEPFAPFASLTRMIPTADLLVTVHTPGNRDGLGGFAHWVGGRMTRCFYATREHIIEDTGLPLPAEAAFWEGDTEAHGIELPFRPSEMAAAAVTHWLGFRVSDEIDIPVAAFAVDGRPEVRTGRPGDLPVPAVPAPPVRAGTAGDATTVTDDYDDYADRPDNDGESRPTGELLRGAAVSVLRGVRWGFRWLRSGAHRIGDEVRRRARQTGR
ncbi:DUF6928 family protein [Corynebacterium neomassiliense]|uniref:DUF6928 family protein n=1 Tax=Corynebacterium neomassiliense TaxID=2079482 RepID=UPI001030AE35|nr:hypothetical protein [Corynebacterium neomassiliense]